MVAIADIEADIEEYVDYDLVGSLTRANAFIRACRLWLAFSADSASNQSSSMTIGKQYVQDMLRRAEQFAARKSGNGGVRFLGPGRHFR